MSKHKSFPPCSLFFPFLRVEDGSTIRLPVRLFCFCVHLAFVICHDSPCFVKCTFFVSLGFGKCQCPSVSVSLHQASSLLRSEVSLSVSEFRLVFFSPLTIRFGVSWCILSAVPIPTLLPHHQITTCCALSFAMDSCMLFSFLFSSSFPFASLYFGSRWISTHCPNIFDVSPSVIRVSTVMP